MKIIITKQLEEWWADASDYREMTDAEGGF